MGLWSRVKAALTRRPRIVVDGGGVVAVQPLSQQYCRIGGNLTPADVSTILLQADGGDCSRLVELGNECRQKDGHLHSTLRSRETALSALPFVVEPYAKRDRKPTARDSEIASFVEEAITNACGDGQDVRGFDDLLPHMQGAVYHGHSVDETQWTRDGRYLVPYGFRHIDQRRFAFREVDGRLVFVPYAGLGVYGRNGIDLVATYPYQYIQHQPREMGDVPAREGLSRLLVWCALFRNWGVADWMKLAELSWKPWRLGKLTKDAGQRDREQLLEMLEYLTSGGVALYPGDKVELDLRWPEHAGGVGKSNHHELCEFMGAEMSKAVIGQTLTTEAGDRGARALGQVHDAVRKDIRAHDAKRVNSTLRMHLVEPLVRLNFGPSVPLPKTYIATDEAVDLKTFGEGVKALKDAGLKIGAAWVYDVSGVPCPDADEEILGDGDEADEPEGEDVDTSELDEDEGNEDAGDAQEQDDDAYGES